MMSFDFDKSSDDELYPGYEEIDSGLEFYRNIGYKTVMQMGNRLVPGHPELCDSSKVHYGLCDECDYMLCCLDKLLDDEDDEEEEFEVPCSFGQYEDFEI